MFHFGTNHTPNGGTASCRSAVFFAWKRRGEDFERKGEDLEEDSERTWRMGEDFEMTETGLGEEGR